MSKGYKSQPEIAPSGQSWDNLSSQTNNIVLGYNPKYEINIYELTLIHIND